MQKDVQTENDEAESKYHASDDGKDLHEWPEWLDFAESPTSKLRTMIGE
jgi:hypothetical protein